MLERRESHDVICVCLSYDVVKRTSEFLTPFVLMLSTEANVRMNFTWVVDEPDLVDIKNAFAVTTPDSVPPFKTTVISSLLSH